MNRIVILALLWLTAWPSGALAQAAYPVKPIRLIVAFAPGSSTDAVARIVADELGKRLGQNVIVENRAGANGQIASAFVAQSAPDGYTLLISSNTTHAANPHLYRKLPYDPGKDFTPLARLGNIPFMLVINPAVPARTMAELLTYARAHPGKLSFASSNSTSQVAAETINVMAKTQMVGVPYKSSQQAIIDLVGNQVQLMLCDFAVAMPQVKAGKLRALAVPMSRRTPLMADLPPIDDTLKGFDFTPWNALWAPAGTPKDIVARLVRELLALAGSENMKARLAGVGIEVNPLGGEAFGKFIEAERLRWGRLIKAAGIEPE